MWANNFVLLYATIFMVIFMQQRNITQSINRAWVSNVAYIRYYMTVKTNTLNLYVLTWEELSIEYKKTCIMR